MPSPPENSSSFTEALQLLRQLAGERFTGSFRAEQDNVVKVLYLADGKLACASSTHPEDRLGTLLAAEQRITSEQLDTAQDRSLPGEALGSVLVNLGYIQPDDLLWGARRQVEGVLASILTWPEGSFRSRSGPLPERAVNLELALGPALVAAMRHIPDATVERLVGSADALLAARDITFHTELEPQTGTIVNLLDGTRDLAEVSNEAAVGAGQVARVILGLKALDLLDEVAPETEPVVDAFPEAEDHDASRVELTAVSEDPLPDEGAEETEERPGDHLEIGEQTLFTREDRFADSDSQEPTQEEVEREAAEDLGVGAEHADDVGEDEPPEADAPFERHLGTAGEDTAQIEDAEVWEEDSEVEFDGEEDPEPEDLQEDVQEAPAWPPATSGPTRPRVLRGWMVGAALPLLALLLVFVFSGDDGAPALNTGDAPPAEPESAPPAEPGARTAGAVKSTADTPPLDRPIRDEPASQPKPAERETPPPELLAKPANDAKLVISGSSAGSQAFQAGNFSRAAELWREWQVTQPEGAYTLQVMVACKNDTLLRIRDRLPASDQLFLAPVQVAAGTCYKVLWGSFRNRADAEAAFSRVPSLFTSGGDKPWPVPLASLPR